MTLTDKSASFARTETEEGTVGDGENEPEMVRKVAQAMIDARQLPAGTVVNMHAFLRDARAAIAAMRDPGSHVINAVEKKAEERYHAAPALTRWYGEDVWAAGIDAALGNPEVAR